MTIDPMLHFLTVNCLVEAYLGISLFEKLKISSNLSLPRLEIHVKDFDMIFSRRESHACLGGLIRKKELLIVPLLVGLDISRNYGSCCCPSLLLKS